MIKVMSDEDRRDEVSRGIRKFGWDFYMCAPRRNEHEIIAAPFHIENEEDRQLFISAASSSIRWVAHRTSSLYATTVDSNEFSLEMVS